MENLKKEIQRAIDSHTKKSKEAVERFNTDMLSAIKFDYHITAAYNQEIAKYLTAILESGNLTKEDFLNRIANSKKRLSNTIRTQEDIIMHSVIVEMISLMETYAEINH
jgi:predicted nuclease of restriction endonuclease-like (RecB) superfamily